MGKFISILDAREEEVSEILLGQNPLGKFQTLMKNIIDESKFKKKKKKVSNDAPPPGLIRIAKRPKKK